MVNGALKIERAKTSKPRADFQPLPAHRRTHQMRDDQAARTGTYRAAPNTIAEKWRIGSGFDYSSYGTHASAFRKFAPFRSRDDGGARSPAAHSQKVLPELKAITFHLRRI
jgi:hypothetical protein